MVGRGVFFFFLVGKSFESIGVVLLTNAARTEIQWPMYYLG